MLIQRAEVMLHQHQGGRAPQTSACKAAAVGQSVEAAEPQQAAAPPTRQEHNRAQTKAFSTLEAVQASRLPPDLPTYQASAFLAAEAIAPPLLRAAANLRSAWSDCCPSQMCGALTEAGAHCGSSARSRSGFEGD